jgi:hypothetical protein
MASAEQLTIREWVEAAGAKIDPRLTEAPIPEMGGGYGVVAREPIQPGSRLAVIPKHLLVTAASSRKACRLPGSIPAIDSIVVFLVTERLLCEADPSRQWAPWITRLPKAYDNFLEFEDVVDPALVNRVSTNRAARRSPEDASRFFQAAERLLPIRRYREKMVDEIENLHRLCDRLLERPDELHFTVLARTDPAKLAQLNRNLVRWGFNSLMSRGFGYSKETWAMMPWVDYFNYSTQPSVRPSENASGGFDFTAAESRTVATGQQLLLNYGIYTDIELAQWYGFCLCAPPTEAVDEDDDDVVGEWHHHEHCAYVFSPMADTDGEYPKGTRWAIELATAAGLVEIPSTWKPVASATLGDCRISRAGCSAGFQNGLVEDLAAANGVTPVECVRRLLQAEWAMNQGPATDGDAAAQSSQLPQLAEWARRVSGDSADLLSRVMGLTDDELEAWLEADD